MGLHPDPQMNKQNMVDCRVAFLTEKTTFLSEMVIKIPQIETQNNFFVNQVFCISVFLAHLKQLTHAVCETALNFKVKTVISLSYI